MRRFITKIGLFLNRPFPVLNSLKVRFIFAIGMFIFSLLFLLLFIPFNITEWIVYTSPFKALQIPGLATVVGLIILVSQTLQYFIFKNRTIKNLHIIFSLFLDILFISIPLSLLYSIPANSFWIEFRKTLAIVMPLSVLCYIIGITLMIVWGNYRQKGEVVAEANVDIEAKPASVIDRINIKDSNGQIKLSLRPEDLLYFESADNYVIVHFRKKHQIGRELVRNSLKNIERDHADQGCLRCHRSYIVNMINVQSIRKRGRAFEVDIEGVSLKIPISRGYVKNVSDMLEGA